MTQLEEIEVNAADGIISIDDDGHITHFNTAAELIFGCARIEVIGQPLSTLLPEQSRGHHDAYIQRFANSKDTSRTMGQRAPVVGRRKDGSIVPLEISIMRHSSQGKRRYTAILRDISRRVERERALAEKERKFRAIFDGSYQFVALISTDGTVLELNHSALQFVGGELHDYAGQPLWQAAFCSGDTDRASLREAITHAADGAFSHLIVNIRGASGGSAKLDLSIKAIRTSFDTVEFLIAEGRDVTELVDINDALRRSETRLANAQKIARLGNWEWNLLTNQLLWSDEVYRIFGFTPDTFGASYDAFLASVHPDDRQMVQTAVNLAISEGRPYSLHHRIICPDGSLKIVQEIGEVLVDENDAPIIMSGTVQDVTDAREREQALARARDDAEAANRSKSLFLATMSHELRTPLNAIIGFGEIMAGQMFGPLGQPAYGEYSSYILQSGQHLLRIINDILDVTRIESGVAEANYSQFDPHTLIEAALRFVSKKADGKGLTLVARPEGKGHLVYLDERLCKQILINLLGNAVKFTEHGGKVEIGFEYNGDKASFIVSDTGVGINREDLARVFDPFFQSEGPYARKYDGVGLGLTIAKNLAELQKGTVSIKSKYGIGTTVRVDLPPEVVVVVPEQLALRQAQ